MHIQLISHFVLLTLNCARLGFIFHFVLLALNCACLGACSTGLATLASAKQARANPHGTVFSQGWNNYVLSPWYALHASLTVWQTKPPPKKPTDSLSVWTAQDSTCWLLRLKHDITAVSPCHCQCYSQTDWVQECGLGMKQVVILHECLQRCKLWSVITQCWSRPTITDYHGQIFGFEQPCMLSDLKCTDICSWFYKHHGLYY